MAIVTEISWDDMLDGKPLPETPARKAWREAVAEITTKAHEKLPECNGRIERAVKIVLAGDVELLADGTAKVASQTQPQTTYLAGQGHCDCKDFAKAPQGLCKHRLAYGIQKRAYEAVNSFTKAPVPQPLPEAPASANVRVMIDGREVQVTLRDVDEGRLLARMARLLAQYPTASSQAPAVTQTPVCQWHGAMKESHQGERHVVLPG